MSVTDTDKDGTADEGANMVRNRLRYRGLCLQDPGMNNALCPMQEAWRLVGVESVLCSLFSPGGRDHDVKLSVLSRETSTETPLVEERGASGLMPSVSPD